MNVLNNLIGHGPLIQAINLLPVSQCCPENPAEHWHVYPSTLLTQTPEFMQVTPSQLSMSETAVIFKSKVIFSSHIFGIPVIIFHNSMIHQNCEVLQGKEVIR